MNWVQPKFSDFISRPSKKQKTESLNRKKVLKLEESPEELVWLNKWKPRKKSDLVVHKKKIEEVEKWLEHTKQKSGSSILLLYGPPGCGKLTTLRVLCNECSINLVEWLPQVALSSYNPDSFSSVPYRSEISVFEEFVKRATRYSNVLNRNSCRLIVVKDIPLQYFKDTNVFQAFLRTFMDVKGVNIVFIVSDFKTTRELFSDDVKKKFNIHTIQFNPITQRNTLIALQKIANGKFSEHLNGLSLSCAGDLRNAINTLQFLSVKGALPKKKNQELTKSDSVDIFHGIGRVLYAKREENGKLKHSPIEIAESFTSSPDHFVNMLQENYLGTFSSIHEVAKASDCLSKSDLLLKPLETSFATVALSLSCFSLMSYNSYPIKKFQHFNRPTRICNHLVEYRCISKDSESLIDTVSYGRHIPSFSSISSKEMFAKIKKFGELYTVPFNMSQ